MSSRKAMVSGESGRTACRTLSLDPSLTPVAIVVFNRATHELEMVWLTRADEGARAAVRLATRDALPRRETRG